MSMKRKIMQRIIIQILSFNIVQAVSFHHISHSAIVDQATIEIKDNGITRGTISYTKIPYTLVYTIHDLYIAPEFRRCGYATRLIQYVCNYLQGKGARRIYARPEPFEKEERRKTISCNELIQLYVRCGFSGSGNIVIKDYL